MKTDKMMQMVEMINQKGPSLEVLYFIDYFSHMNRKPQEHVYNLLTTNGYIVSTVNLI